MPALYECNRRTALDAVSRLVLKHGYRSRHSASEIRTVSQLVIASSDAAPGYTPGAQVAHDLRNLLATVALHLEALQRLSGPSGTKAADAAQAPLTRGAALCNKALDCTANADNRARPPRRGLDPGRASRRRSSACEYVQEFFRPLEQARRRGCGRSPTAARFEARVFVAPDRCRRQAASAGTISRNLRSRLRESSIASPLCP
jgi:hypothetical protein